MLKLDVGGGRNVDKPKSGRWWCQFFRCPLRRSPRLNHATEEEDKAENQAPHKWYGGMGRKSVQISNQAEITFVNDVGVQRSALVRYAAFSNQLSDPLRHCAKICGFHGQILYGCFGRAAGFR